MATESFPEALDPNAIHVPLPMIYKYIHEKKSSSASTWGRIVEAFTTGNLTFSTDKLIALSGMSEILSNRVQLTYLGGLWKENLETQLPWYVKTNHPRPNGYRAPSWSWASVDGEIINPRNLSSEAYITVEDASVQLSTANKFGQVSGGFLQLRLRTILPKVTIIKEGTLMKISEVPENWES
jgi:hypothetical protein